MNPRMKFVIISFVMLTTATATSYAQKLHVGVVAGANMYKITGRSYDNKSQTGFSAGAYGEYTISRLLAIQPELLFSQTIGNLDPNSFSQIYPGAISSKVYLNYISLPVMVAFKPTPEISVLLGPQYSYLVSQTTGLLPGNAYGNKDAYKKSDVSLVFGGQLNLNKVKIGIRYTVGLQDINNINPSDTWKYHGFHFYLGYRLK